MAYFLTFNRLKGKQFPIICTLYAQKEQDRLRAHTKTLQCIHIMFIHPQLSEQPDNISLEGSTFWKFNAASNSNMYQGLRILCLIFCPILMKFGVSL
jgi:hypothetical protein